MAPQRHGDFGFRDVQHCASQLSTIGGQGALQAAVFTQSPTCLAVVVTTGTVCVCVCSTRTAMASAEVL